MINKKETTKYAYCNHWHEIDENYEMVDFGDGEFVANKKAIPLLKALNKIGLKTRTHHITDEHENAFVSILLDNTTIEVRKIRESGDRTKYNGKMEVLISWKK